MSSGHLITGKLGEELAEAYLREKGFRVVERNFRVGQGEIDLVCEDGETLVFVEVKTRRSPQRGEPGEAVGRVKQARLVRAACAYLSARQCWSRSCRFDVVGIVLCDGSPVVRHSEDILDVRNALGGGHATWQPW